MWFCGHIARAPAKLARAPALQIISRGRPTMSEWLTAVEYAIPMRITFVLWRGDIGGAERLTVELAAALRAGGVEADVLFVTNAALLQPQLQSREVPYRALGLRRGSEVLARPRYVAAALNASATDVVISVSVGYLGAAIRAGGFRGPIVGVEHGNLIRLQEAPLRRNFGRWLNRLSGVITHDAEIAVSNYMARLVAEAPHTEVNVIPHGIRSRAEPVPLPGDEVFTVGYVGRLYPGKGIDVLLRAVAELKQLSLPRPLRVRIAGDGQMKDAWLNLASRLEVLDVVSFDGWTDDVAGHWARCHVAVAPNDTFVESFCMSIVEAMACGRPTIVTDGGALPELVVAGETGSVVPAGSVAALAAALEQYARMPAELDRQARAARSRAMTGYSLDSVAERYERLCRRLVSEAGVRTGWKIARARQTGAQR
jgi:glycosyltransferase involved in cell wall biosynthesis